MTRALSAQDVAQYLREHPAFFLEFPEVFADLQLPDAGAHGGRAVSIAERQALVLRERMRAMESRLAEMLRIGRDNDQLALRLEEWTLQLFARDVRDAGKHSAQVAADAICRVFAIPFVEVRLWSPAPETLSSALGRWAQTLEEPRCGAPLDLALIPDLPPGWESARSHALIPLRMAAPPRTCFGLIALGAPDPERFAQSKGISILTRIGVLASAALAPELERDVAGEGAGDGAPGARGGADSEAQREP